jgi:perosamine synthetase
MIRMFAPFMSDEAVEGAATALRERMIGEGETVKQFEAALCNRFGFHHALLLNSGTAGLRLALAVAGVGPGDEVITTAMTCTATNMPILEQYAVPVFADIQHDTGNLDPADIGHRVTERTKAIVCVHWGGYPCDMAEIHAVAVEHGLCVIEDAAHALGAYYRGRPVGTLSRFTMFSFQAIKTLTTVDGGLLTMLDQGDWQEAKERRWFGIDRDKRSASARWPGYWHWAQKHAGYKYQPTNIQAAIGLANLKWFDRLLARRAALAAFYRQELADVPGVQLFEQAADRRGAWWLFTVHVEGRQAFHDMMKAKDVETSVCHIRNDLHPVFAPARDDLPVLDRFQESYICIPLHHEVTDEDAEHIVKAVRGGW